MNVLTVDDLKVNAPSIFAEQPYYRMSEHYRFVPTISVVEALQQNNFYPVRATQSKSRIEGKKEYTKHMIRFRRMLDINSVEGEEIPELVLTNSHDGTSAYKLMLGIYRVRCSNGLVVCTGSIMEVSTRHSGIESLPQQVIDASFQVINESPAVLETIASWKTVELTQQQQIVYASSALELRDSALALQPEEVLQPRRHSDKGSSLWQTFNRVQENILKGGVEGVNKKGKHIHTRTVKCVNEDLRLNRALWKLTEEMNKLVKR